ncbi:Aurora kinase C [Tritrichomonas foetus]|uniref:Aurora kinase C n=1 Tax=Tritrichomonas foetus TaxID=1144522 RepID=A0A1J4JAW6_9EUKA|nr:Aurora kinase C [Tritrichomonas foetus]|eukprot:OHS94573.1 Aurora kinase C [Tritrichomonas foetus]
MLIKRQEELLMEARKNLYHHGFELDAPIGDGGFATVYLVKSRQYHENFAVKLIDLEVDETQTLPESFRAEISALINLYHPNVIKIFDHFCSETLLYIVLEYCPGGSISDLYKKHGCIRPPVLYELCQQIISALMFCHQRGIAHRDVKPSNILLDKYGRAKLADFGLAMHFNKSQLSKMFGGSLAYLAPEILKKNPFNPMKADVWALGVTFYEMATGQLPFQSDTPEGILKEIKTNRIAGLTNFPTPFLNALRLMLCVNPANRITIDEVAMLPVFQSTKMSPATKSLSRSDALTPKKRMNPISSSMHFNRSSSVRRTCIYTKKRTFSMRLKPTFENATMNDDEDINSMIEEYENA